MSGEMTHVVELAETIGPRPATSDAEAAAADYVQGVFETRGLPVERQEFDTPRTYSWAFVIYHMLTIGAAVLSHWWLWPAFVLGVVSAVLMWLDLDTRGGLSAFMPKGPSQNVIARHVPRVGRNERVHRIVIVAHYDSARSSLAFSPGMVRNFGMTFGLMKALTFAVPVLVAISALPWLKVLKLWPWYVTVAASAYLLVPLLINVHRELAMKPVPGANDNASGVAAMLGVMERIVPEPDASWPTQALRVRRGEEEAREAEVVPADVMLTYEPVSGERRQPELWAGGDEDIDWDEPAGPARGQTALDMPAPAATEPPHDQEAGESAGDAQRRKLFGRAPAQGQERRGMRDWLGVGTDFDARREGKDIGSWDRFHEPDEDEDEIGWKGGSAAAEGLDDPGFPASEAARIRRRATQESDRDLSEKEVWFVATGAEEVGTWGMRAFLKEHGPELHDALIINIDNVGSGAVTYVSAEGMARMYHSDRRLMSAARRAVVDGNLSVRSRVYKGLSTDATPALARGYRAMSVMAFDINGRLPNWHWATDTVDNVDEANLEQAADFVCAVIREL